MSGWICGSAALVVIGLVLVWIFLRARVYRGIFADLQFVEMARGVARVKAAAFDRIVLGDAGIESPYNDPRVLLSSAGLVFAYTVRQVEDGYVHHYSISVGGGYTAHAVGEMYVLLAAKVIGVPYDRLALGIGTSTVHHAEFVLSEAENEALRGRAVLEFSVGDVAAFRKEWMEVRDRLHWQRAERIHT